MKDKRIISICKNSIVIALTICLLAFFSLVNHSLNRSYAAAEGQRTESGDSSVVASVSYQELDTDAGSDTYGEYVEKVETFTSFSDAFAGAKVVYDRLNADVSTEEGTEPSVPVIQLQQDITMEASFVAGEDEVMDVALDVNGHQISLGQGYSMDFGGCNISLMDTTAEEGSAGATQLPGGIVGDAEYLLQNSATITVVSGYYQNETGAIVGESGQLLFENGYLVVPNSYIALTVPQLSVNGGFFCYADTAGMVKTGEVVLAEEMAFAKTTISLGETELTGYSLTGPGYKLVVHCLEGNSEGDLVYYYKKFDETWEQAIAYSQQYDGATAEITIYDPQIDGVGITHTYCIDASADAEVMDPVIKLSGISFQRAEAFAGGFFQINAGTLILSDCTLNGVLEESQTATGALICVNNDGVLQLEGTSESGTTIEKNNSRVGTAGDAGAGISLGSGARLQMAGNVSVKNNTTYTAATEETEAATSPCNIYMQEGAQIVLRGAITSPQRSIGITRAGTVEPGVTVLGCIGESYLQELIAAAGSVEAIDVSDSLGALFMDGVASYYVTYVPDQNQFVWNRDVCYLPEAGRLRLEYVLLLVGLIGFLVRNLKPVKAKGEMERYVTVFAMVCLILGAGIGFYNVRQEMVRIDNNMQAVETLVSSPLATPAYEEEKEVTQEATVETVVEPSLLPKDGRDYYGVVEIPALSIRLPVLTNYTDADMKTTPCVYYGCLENNDLVIVGHNYDSQFGTLNDCSDVLDVYLYLPDGSVYQYQSVAKEALNPDQVDEMLTGDWDLTLFTCSYSGEKRVAIRCVLVR